MTALIFSSISLCLTIISLKCRITSYNVCYTKLLRLARDGARSDALAVALTDIQEIENSLPYERTKRVRSQIPVGVYNIIADFGQARGTNTATILPNDADHARKYGRTIMLRYNIMTEPTLFSSARARFCSYNFV